MRIRIQILTCAILLLIFSGCYPKGPEYTSDLDLVYTNYSTSFDFSARKTYSIPDSIIQITGQVLSNGGGKPAFLSQVYAAPILAQLKTNMSSYGWTQVDKTEHPDAILLVSSMTTNNIYYYYDWDYWDWWYPGWYPDWGWYYPGWYYPAYVTGYRSGSIFVQMVDNASVTPQTGNVPVVWNCILNGLAEGSTTDITTRLQTSIATAFRQSPYLKH